MFYSKSPRAVTVDQIAELTQGLEKKTKVVALFVNPSEAEVKAVVDSGRISLLQFHGEETECFCQSFGAPYLKAIRVKEYKDIEHGIALHSSADMILLDSFKEKAPGGTGKKFDWELGRAAVNNSEVKIVIAGGLNPINVSAAVEQIGPFGVDVSSGVEISHGIKDMSKVEAFIKGARSVRS